MAAIFAEPPLPPPSKAARAAPRSGAAPRGPAAAEAAAGGGKWYSLERLAVSGCAEVINPGLLGLLLALTFTLTPRWPDEGGSWACS